MNQKKIALITGASSGIGREFAHIHAERRGDLVVVARREDRLKQLKTELETKYGITVQIIAKDLSRTDAAKEIYNEVKQAGIEIDYLINNAGFGALGKFHELELKRNINQIHVNVTALTALTWFFLPDFIKRNSGRILFTSSTASLVPGPLQAVYYATKSYVTSFSYALSEELRDTHITTTALMPGATATEFGAIVGIEKTALWNNLSTPRTIAEDGYNAMLEGRLDVISGLTWIQRLQLFFAPVTPMRVLLKQVYALQTSKE